MICIEIEICLANTVHTPLHCLFTTYSNLSLYCTKKQEMIRLLDLSYRGSLSQSVSQWHSSRVQKDSVSAHESKDRGGRKIKTFHDYLVSNLKKQIH